MLFKNWVVRYSLTICGVLLVCIGVIGIVIPGLPTTIFLILAAACFAKSSPKLHQKLLDNKWFGPIIDNWNRNKSIPLRAKQIAIVMILLSYGYTWYSLESHLVKAVIAIMLLPVILYLLRLPLSESDPKKD